MPSRLRKKQTSEVAAAEAEATAQDNRTALKKAEEQRIVSSWLSQSIKSTQPSQQNGTSHTTAAANGSMTNSHNPSDPSAIGNNTKDEDAEEEDNDSTFSAEDEVAGLAFPTASSSDLPQRSSHLLDRTNASANDKLRVRLLGSAAAAKKFTANANPRGGTLNGVGVGLVASKPMPRPPGGTRGRDTGGGSDDGEEGRTGITGPREKRSSSSKEKVSPGVTVTGKNQDRHGEVDGAPRGGDDRNTTLPSSSSSKTKKRPASYMDELLAKRDKKKNKK